MVPNHRFPRFPLVLITLGVLCLLTGSYLGLFVAPPEHYMGNVQRIMYVHVPTAWNALLAMTFAFAAAIVSLFKSDLKWDARLEAAIEVGVLLAFLLCCQGAIWAKPTWGVWWDWDPRLTTTAVLLFAFAGLLALIPAEAFPRGFLTDIAGVSLGTALIAYEWIRRSRARTAPA